MMLSLEGGRMVFKPAATTRKKIDSIDKWLSAFHTFMAVYLEKHPARAGELLKYAETIRAASHQFPGLGWRAYDEQFRLRRAADPASSWADMDLELWVTVAAMSGGLGASYTRAFSGKEAGGFGADREWGHA